MNELAKRGLVGLVFLGIMINAILWNQWIFAGLFAIITALATVELVNLVKEMLGLKDSRNGIYIGFAVLGYGLLVAPKFTGEELYLYAFPFVILLAHLYNHFFDDTAKGSYANPFIFVLLVLPFGLLNYFTGTGYSENFNPDMLLAFFILVWTHDTLSYLVGKAIGETKLAPGISPGKTYEGLVGGVICTAAVAVVLRWQMGGSIGMWLPSAFIISIFATLGDLSESFLKRKAGKKDSSALLPGHGGILDRFDGVFFSAPTVFAYNYIFINL